MRNSTAALVLASALTVACGGERKTADTTRTQPGAQPAAAPPASSTATAAPTGKTWDVKMLGDPQGYRFDPASIDIKPGDAVRWTSVSGPPHNVTFWPDSIPANAAASLGADMPKTTAPLSGPLISNVNETYTIVFANVPSGTYHYYCTPHLAFGMKGVINVR